MYFKYLNTNDMDSIKLFAEKFVKQSYLDANRISTSGVTVAELTIEKSVIKIRVEIGDRDGFYAEEQLKLTPYKAFIIGSYSPEKESIELTKQWTKLLYRIPEYKTPAAAKSYKHNYRMHLRGEKSQTIKNAKEKYSELAL